LPFLRPKAVLVSNLHQDALSAGERSPLSELRMTPGGGGISILGTPDRVIDVGLRGNGIGGSSEAAGTTWVASTDGISNLALE
jgi:hypothetical protein